MEPVPSTPSSRSSFARLKDALDSLEAREKYRARTNSPSDGDDVRWYFSKTPLPLEAVAASTPVSEVVGRGDFLRFSINDSLSLEAAFLTEEEELVSAWWKEYAECSEGPLETPENSNRLSSTISHDANEVAKFVSDTTLYESDEVIGISVKGGLYEVDLYRRRCFPVYWTGDHRRVLRGHWFAQKGGLDWLPLREDVSEQLEFAYRSQIWHRRTFQPSGKFAARVNLQSSIEGLHALFTGEDDTWEAWLEADLTGIISVLGFKGSSFRLRRGFAPSLSLQPTQDELQQRKEEEMDDYCSQVPVRHLVFMVHGIGQRLENANLIDDVGTFRRTTTLLSEQHLTAYQRNSLRVLFIPCQWRRGLKLRGEEAVESCTLEGVRALRTMLSATVHDVLYYMSPIYCQDIIDSVCGQLNMLYRKFIKRNPGYDGKVSIYGHSLGSVLSFDILCHQTKLTSNFPVSQLHEHSQDLDAPDLWRTVSEGEKDLSRSKQHAAQDTKVDRERPQDYQKQETNGSETEMLENEIGRLKEKIVSLEGTHDSSEQQGGAMNKQPSESEQQHIDVESTINNEEYEQTDYREDEEAKHNSSDLSHEPTSSRKGHFMPSPNSKKGYTPYIEYTKLDFEVDTFFAVGSPLGVFLSLRNIRLGIGNGQDYWQDDGIEEEMPACKRLFNIFHPFDPVAYRIEPLVCKEYLNTQPVFVPYHRGGRRLHIGMQEFGKEMSARSKAFVQSISAAGDRVIRVFSAAIEKEEIPVQQPEERTYGSLMIQKLTGEPNGRIDFMLQDATFEHQYLQAISSHTAYWQDADTALFILKHLYRDIPEYSPEYRFADADENAAATAQYGSDEASHILEDNNPDDEEVAFTFSHTDRLMSVRSDTMRKVSSLVSIKSERQKHLCQHFSL
ncbi:hypothetical protein KP509_30G063100 [Ceratopteris richardii]|uniref:DDHD domain-containing protein n=1 Tax=Ceratopteris richardii TaxID=49495 RepID=A0A8T2R465_CERRI|nr:hypothetical protein KP509_30G063100 [Ceratopteris richardii]